MKKFLAFLLTLIILFNLIIPVKAAPADTYEQYREYLIKIMSDIGYVGTLPFKGLSVMLTEFGNKLGFNDIPETETDLEAAEWINNGIRVEGDNVSIVGRQYQFIKYIMDEAQQENQYRYFYTLRLSDYEILSWQNHIQLVNQYYKDYWVICYSNLNKYMMIPKQYARIVYVSDGNDNAGYIDFVDIRNNTTSFANGCLNFSNFQNTGAVNGQATNILCAASPAAVGKFLNENAFLVSNQYEALTVYDDDGNLISGNVAPYYLKDSYNTNIAKDSYNTTKSSIDNSITIGDITRYVNEYVDENDEYPTPTEINVYIDNYIPTTPVPTPTPTPGPNYPIGSGTVSGGVVNNNFPNISNNPTFNNNPNINITLFPTISGNGLNGGTVSGNGSSSGSIFDWISDIGGVIGDFIKNVGELIADVVRGITETITTIMSTIPNLLSSLVEFVYGGLPDELKALVTLGITAVVLVSVIKILRK